MLKQVIYKNHSCEIFPGFYESILFNSDSEYYANEVLQDQDHPDQYELKDFEGFQAEVSKKAADLLHEAVVFDNSIIQAIDFEGLSSPKYYNFETDRLILKVKLDQRKLELYCFRQEREVFDEYLKENFTSRDGFASFIENNVNAFKNQYIEENKKDRTLDIMIEFYILQQFERWENKDSYLNDLSEAANEILFNYMEAVEQ